MPFNLFDDDTPPLWILGHTPTSATVPLVGGDEMPPSLVDEDAPIGARPSPVLSVIIPLVGMGDDQPPPGSPASLPFLLAMGIAIV